MQSLVGDERILSLYGCDLVDGLKEKHSILRTSLESLSLNPVDWIINDSNPVERCII